MAISENSWTSFANYEWRLCLVNNCFLHLNFCILNVFIFGSLSSYWFAALDTLWYWYRSTVHCYSSLTSDTIRIADACLDNQGMTHLREWELGRGGGKNSLRFRSQGVGSLYRWSYRISQARNLHRWQCTSLLFPLFNYPHKVLTSKMGLYICYALHNLVYNADRFLAAGPDCCPKRAIAAFWDSHLWAQNSICPDVYARFSWL